MKELRLWRFTWAAVALLIVLVSTALYTMTCENKKPEPLQEPAAARSISLPLTDQS